MIGLTIAPSPSPDVLLERYDEAAFPGFGKVFDDPGLPRPLHMGPDEARVAIVLQNLSDKEITALKYRWQFIDESGQQHTRMSTSDSYTTGMFRAVAEPHAKQLISPINRVDEAIISRVAGGGGYVCSGGSTRFPDADEYTFAIDLILFADGEIAGPDPDGYALELLARKPAAEFVAKQIRLAEAEKRDVTPVLLALSQIPCIGRIGQGQGDPRVHYTRYYAEQYLRFAQVGKHDRREGILNRLEHIPAVPKFYHRPA